VPFSLLAHNGAGQARIVRTSDPPPPIAPPGFTLTQDEYSSISRNASIGVHGYALVFSTTSRSSFENVIKINEALLNALGDAPDVPRVLVGSMKDLPEEREVPLQQAQSLADSWRIPYLECSSKTGENVAEVFHTLLKEIEKDDGLLNENENEKCIIL
jgi:Ras family protein